MVKRIGLFVGSFDPMTLGHLDLIERSSQLFDQLIVLVAGNINKHHLFPMAKRVDLVEQAVNHLDNVSVDQLPADQMTVTYCQEHAVTAIVRGLRNSTDFDYEWTIYGANQSQAPEIETVFLYAAAPYRHLSSSIVRELAQFGGDITEMVPPVVRQAIEQHTKI